MSARRVALITAANFYVGPDIARRLAATNHDLVLGDASDELVAELEALGSRVVNVIGGSKARSEEDYAVLVKAGLDAFGQIHAATMFSGVVVTGRFLDSSAEDLSKVVAGCIEQPYHFLKAIVPTMVEHEDGQILVLTSATASRPTFGAPLYSAARAGGTMLAKNVAEEVVRKNVQVNVLGTNFMDFPEFLRASGATDPAVRSVIESQVPMRRLGTVEECAALCSAFLDGTSRFMTGQWISFSGGWS